MTTDNKDLNLPSPSSGQLKTIKIGTQEFKVDASESSSQGATGEEAIKSLEKALKEGVFAGLPNTENDQTN